MCARVCILYLVIPNVREDKLRNPRVEEHIDDHRQREGDILHELPGGFQVRPRVTIDMETVFAILPYEEGN